MQVTVTLEDGTTEQTTISLGALTLQESCDVEETLGAERFAAYQSGDVTPVTLRAVIWAKLRRRYPDLDVSDFDLDLVEAVDEGKDPIDKT